MFLKNRHFIILLLLVFKLKIVKAIIENEKLNLKLNSIS